MMDSTVMFGMLLTIKEIVVYLILVLFLIDLAKADSYNKIARILKILLFPLLLIFNVHYKKISPIVKKTAEEFGLPYHSFRTFFDALSCHTRHLKELGTA